MAGTFGYMYGTSEASQADVLLGLAKPSIPSGTLTQAVSLVGAVIMPHNIYLHSALVQSRDIDRRNVAKVAEANFYYKIESTIALAVSFAINVFVVGVFATLGSTDDSCGSDINLFTAGQCLADKYGGSIIYIWAVGLLAAGQSSTMTGTYAGQFVMQGFLKLNIAPWKRVLLTRSIAIIPAICIAAIAKDGDDALSSLGEYLNVLQSIQLPFALLPILIFTSSGALMSDTFKNGKPLQIILWSIGFLVFGMNIYLVISFFEDTIPPYIWLYVIIGILGFLYIFFVAYIMTDSIWFVWLKKKLTGKPSTSKLYPTYFAEEEEESKSLIA